MTGARLPHSEIPGSTSGCRLPEAYRRLPRPSSAPDAKASTVRPKKLEHTKRSDTTKPKNTPPTPAANPRKETPGPKTQETRNRRNDCQAASFSVKRCSRPLCSSQTTTSTTTHPLRGGPVTARVDQKKQPSPIKPSSPLTERHQVLWGSGPRFLRTQQRVRALSRPVPLVPTPPPRRGGGTRRVRAGGCPSSQCSTYEQPVHDTNGRADGSWTSTAPTGPRGGGWWLVAGCSLERR